MRAVLKFQAEAEEEPPRHQKEHGSKKRRKSANVDIDKR
jgi:hypothetical protein